MYFRIVQVANSKLEAHQEFARKRMPEDKVPMTLRQE